MCEKSRELAYLVNHKLCHSKLCEPVSHTPVHCGGTPRVVIVAQEVNGFVVLPGDGPQIITALDQPCLVSLLLAAWLDGVRCSNSWFILQQVEECDRVVNTVYEQHVILVGNLQVIHKLVGNTACRFKEGPVAVLYLASVDNDSHVCR